MDESRLPGDPVLRGFQVGWFQLFSWMKKRLWQIIYATLTGGISYLSLLLLIEENFGAVLKNQLVPFLSELLLVIVIFNIIWAGIPVIHRRTRKRWKIETNPLKTILVNGILTTFFVSGVFLFSFLTYGFILDGEMKVPEDHHLWEGLLVCLLFSSLIQLITLGRYFYVKWKDLLLKTEDLKREKLHAELEALKAQINPHFLFNGLSILSALIEEDPKAAQETVHEMALVYRYVLEVGEKNTIQLKSELDFIRSMSSILQKRFGKSFCLSISVRDEHLDYSILPLTLQMLVENAVKHNILSSIKPLHIQITTTDENALIVSNNFQPKKVHASGKIGLKNIGERYKILVNKEIVVENTNEEFFVRLPLFQSTRYEHINN